MVSDLPGEPPTPPSELLRAGWFPAVLLLIDLVGDGWSGRPIGLRHQLLLLPITLLFLVCIWRMLSALQATGKRPFWNPHRAIVLAFLFEALFSALFFYEAHHFAALGYHLYRNAAICTLLPVLGALGLLIFAKPVKPLLVFATAVLGNAAGLVLSLASFPLNYLRSDMLPVILWADTNLLHHISPYKTMFVADRIYDFPYLPGIIIAYFPFVAAHLDIRFGSLLYLAASAVLIFAIARRDRRLEVAALLATFLLQPFLQYRHDLYLEPHWFTLVAAYVLMQRRHFVWAAIVFGISMAIYQFSWILFPFILLNALRRQGWLEVLKLALASAVGALLIIGPFLTSAFHRIAHNTVGQWGEMGHALADPINLSYWATYAVHPDKLLRLQAVLMVAIFAVCLFRGRCVTLADTLRCGIVALTVFILFNSIVDGYFYLMLLVPMLLYTCAANGWWVDPAPKNYQPQVASETADSRPQPSM